MEESKEQPQWLVVADWAIRLLAPIILGTLAFLGNALWYNFDLTKENDKRITVIEKSMYTPAQALGEYRALSSEIRQSEAKTATQVAEVKALVNAVQLSLPSRSEFDQLRDEMRGLREELRSLKTGSP